MADPKPGDPGYQEWLNEQIDQHDDQFAKDNPNWEQEHGKGEGK